MNTIRLIASAVLLGLASLGASAAEPGTDGARRERMDKAYEDSRNPNPGPAARAESSVKRGTHRAGAAVMRGAKATGSAVGKGVRKTGEAIGRGGKKLEDASGKKP